MGDLVRVRARARVRVRVPNPNPNPNPKPNPDQVREFYAAWETYATSRSCAQYDKHDVRRAEDRKVRRLMEKLILTLTLTLTLTLALTLTRTLPLPLARCAG